MRNQIQTRNRTCEYKTLRPSSLNLLLISFRIKENNKAFRLPSKSSDNSDLDISDEDDDPLNNANILNDSFIEETPVKPRRPPEHKTEEKENKNTVNTSTNDSFFAHFENMKLTESKAGIPPSQSKSYPITHTQVQLNTIQEDKVDDLDTPFKTVQPGNSSKFITPQVMSFTSRRNVNSTSHKPRNALENEFRMKKVLFQTPISVARPPILPNESITLSMIDTPNKNILITPDEPKLESEARSDIKSKKSLFDTKAVPRNPNAIQINGVEYVVERKLGSGGSSTVFLAKCSEKNIECALKIVNLRGDQAVVDGYLNETKLLAKLQGNKSIINLFDYQLLHNESKLFMVMEKGDKDLHKILESYKQDIPLYELVTFLYQMLESVHYIHKNGVIHSDLKPANFLMVNGRLKLIDFGIASNISVDSTSIIKFSQAGTINYISPEALIDTSTDNQEDNGKPRIKMSTKSDVWSLGCIFYLLLYKKTPFGHIKNMHSKFNAISSPNTVIEFKELPPYYPKMLSDMTKNCLIHNPKERISVAQLLKYPFNMIIPLEKETT
ncbi:TTK family protein [Megaselia abdita]